MREQELLTPVYLVDEGKIIQNLKILQEVEKDTGGKILLAQKAFSLYKLYPLIGQYLAGATASGLYEARLAHEEMQKPWQLAWGRQSSPKLNNTSDQQALPPNEWADLPAGCPENHVFCPAYTPAEMEELCQICDHVIFNSLGQLELHRPCWEKAPVQAGLRINPEFSTQDHAIYDPCAPGSRLGVRREQLPDHLPPGVTGLHVHTLCEQGFEPLLATFRAVEAKFGSLLHECQWLNLGGGHHITKPGYDVAGLKELLNYIQAKYQVQVYLEPGEAIALRAGSLLTTVMDVVENTLPILILDTSAECHMPDVIEMPYRPPLKGGGEPGAKNVTCRLSSRTCLAGDVIGDYSFDRQPRIGDRLECEDMAIYTMVKNNTFNGMPLPDIAVKHPDGSCQVIKRFGYEDFKERLS